MVEDSKKQGEGNKEADRRYRENAEAFAQNEDVKKQATMAEEALSGKEGKDLRKAEEEGKARSKGEG